MNADLVGVDANRGGGLLSIVFLETKQQKSPADAGLFLLPEPASLTNP
jgi:hypothetical protein